MLLLSSLLIAGIVSVHATAIEEVFKKHGIVPDVIPVAPNQFLKVTYENGLEAKEGVELTPTQVKNQPSVGWKAEPGAHYTLIMTDPDAPSRAEPKFREFKHWVVVNIPGNDTAKGQVVAGYVGSGPPKDTGLHRYVFLVYKQPPKVRLHEQIVSNKSRRNRPKFSAAKMAEHYGFGNPIAGNFFQAQYDDYVPTVHQQLSQEDA